MEKKTILFLIFFSFIVVVIFTIFRFSFLSNIPTGFFVDEASIGYNALTIFKSGIDEHGAVFPLYFRAFGDYKNPIFVYSVVPFIAIFGNSVTTVRFAAAFWGGIALLVFGSLIYRMRISNISIYYSFLLLATSPWFVQLSRVAFEVVTVPFFILLAVIAFFELSASLHLRTKKILIWLLIFTIALAGAFYAYTATRLVAPLVYVFALWLLRKTIHWRYLLYSLVIFFLCLSPIVFSNSVYNGALSSRYNLVGLTKYTDSTFDFIVRFSSNYIQHFSPRYLMNGGDENLRHIPSPYGIFYISSIPFVIMGLLYLIVYRRQKFSQFILFIIFLSPVPSALTFDAPHVLRSIVFNTILYIVAAFGINFSLQSKIWLKLLAYTLFFCVCIESLIFLNFYTHSYMQRAKVWFEDDSVRLLQNIESYQNPIFLSSELYYANYVTAYFFSNNHQQLSDIRKYNLINQINLSHGTYIFVYDECTVAEKDSRFILFSKLENACAFVVQ